MKDIEPNPKLNAIAAGLIGLMALGFFVMAYEMSTLIESSEWAFVAVLAGLGGILLLIALLLLRSPPMNAALLQFRSDGFRLETKQVFRGHKVVTLDWADVTTVTLHNGGLYGGRSIKVVHAPAAEVVMFVPAWTNCSSSVILDRLQASAKAAGYTFEKAAGRSQRHWTVTPKI